MKLLSIICTFVSLAHAAVITSRSAPPNSPEPRSEPSVIFNPDLKFVRSATSLLRRITFTTAARDEYCGEFTPMTTSDAIKPLAADCTAIANAAKSMGTGYYTITPGDSAKSEWVTVARAGTCAYTVKLKAESKGEEVRIGTNDVRFQVETTVRRSKDGKAGFSGSVECYNGRKPILANWKLAYAS